MRSTPEGDLKATLRRGALDIEEAARLIYHKAYNEREKAFSKLQTRGFSTCEIRKIYPLKK